MMDVISIGSALVDIFVTSNDIRVSDQGQTALFCEPVGAKLELDSLVVTTGGAGGNTAAGFARLGFRSAVVAELGTDAFSEVVEKDLTTEGVVTDWLIRERREQTGGSVIVVGKNGARTALVYRGAAAQLQPTDLPTQDLSQATWIHISAVGGQVETLKALFHLARQHQVSVSWNPGRLELEQVAQQGIAALGIKCDVLVVNREEWAMIQTWQSAILAAVTEVVITDGSAGGELWVNSQMVQRYKAVEVLSVDDTGAGDAFVTGYVAARLLEKKPEVATTWGVKNAASVVQQVGAKPGLLTRSQLETMT